jgi:hypothetical protein
LGEREAAETWEANAMNKQESMIGVVRPEELYTLEALKGRVGIRDSTLRAARRAGLKVYYRHGRGFILGRDWISHVCSPPEIRENQ